MWCDKARLSALPASPETVERYCAAVLMSKDNPSPGPVVTVIPAIAKFHVFRGLRNPCDDQALREFVVSVRRRYGRPAVQREPLTPCIARGLQRHHLSAGLSRGSPWDWVIVWGTYYLFRISGRYTESAAVQRKGSTSTMITWWFRSTRARLSRGVKGVKLSSPSPIRPSALCNSRINTSGG